MNLIAINQTCSMKWNFYQDVVRYAGAGIQGIGLWRNKLDEIDLADAADFLHEMKMEVSSLSWCGGFTGSCGMSQAQAIDDGRLAIEQAACLGASNLLVYSGGQNGHTRRHCRRLFLQALDELIPHAEMYGVKLLMEVLSQSQQPQWTILQGTDELQQIVQSYPSESLGVALDLFFAPQFPGLAKLISGWIDRIGLVQIADRSKAERQARQLPGAGDLPLKSWIRLLRLAGYRGPLEVEVWGSQIEYLGYDCILAAAQEIAADCRSYQVSATGSKQQSRSTRLS